MSYIGFQSNLVPRELYHQLKQDGNWPIIFLCNHTCSHNHSFQYSSILASQYTSKHIGEQQHRIPIMIVFQSRVSSLKINRTSRVESEGAKYKGELIQRDKPSSDKTWAINSDLRSLQSVNQITYDQLLEQTNGTINSINQYKFMMFIYKIIIHNHTAVATEMEQSRSANERPLRSYTSII